MVKALGGAYYYRTNQIFWPDAGKVREIYIKPTLMYLPEDSSWLFNLCQAPIYGTELLRSNGVTNMAGMFSGATYARPDVVYWEEY